jgi:hypothetical protein
MVMKKAFSALLVIFLTTNLFGQYLFNKEKPLYQMLEEGYQMNIDKTYSFVANGKQYIFSYDSLTIESGDSTIRYIYLFRKDVDGWKIACDKPIDMDYLFTKGYSPNLRQHVEYFYYPYVYYDVSKKEEGKPFHYRKYLDETIINNSAEKYNYIKVDSDGSISTRILKRRTYLKHLGKVDNINKYDWVREEMWTDVKLVPIDNENYRVIN